MEKMSLKPTFFHVILFWKTQLPKCENLPWKNDNIEVWSMVPHFKFIYLGPCSILKMFVTYFPYVFGFIVLKILKH
jgi:hypothetical protein